jgi:hypothetical protein
MQHRERHGSREGFTGERHRCGVALSNRDIGAGESISKPGCELTIDLKGREVGRSTGEYVGGQPRARPYLEDPIAEIDVA